MHGITFVLTGKCWSAYTRNVAWMFILMEARICYSTYKPSVSMSCQNQMKILRELFHWQKRHIRKGRFWTNQHKGSCSCCWSALDSTTLATSQDFLLQFIFLCEHLLITLLLTLLYLWTKYCIFNKAIRGCEIYILTVSFSKIFLHITDLNFLPMKKLTQSILRCKFSPVYKPLKKGLWKI